jgi:hypothetical protein
LTMALDSPTLLTQAGHFVEETRAQKKRCARCLVEKPTSDFHKHHSRRDGLQDWCKRCQRVNDAAKRAALSVAKVIARRQEIRSRAQLGKACGHCGVVKPLDEFTVDRRKPDGRKSTCRPCEAPARRDAWARYRAKQLPGVETCPDGGGDVQ